LIKTIALKNKKIYNDINDIKIKINIKITDIK